MKKFLVLYRSPVTAAEKMSSSTPEQMQASMKRWMDWKEKHGDFQVAWGLPLGETKLLNGDGSTAEGDDTITGYATVQAESLEAALEQLKDHPHLIDSDGNFIAVHEMLSMPGIES